MTICVDFDGVLHAYSKGWQDGSIYDQPVPGAVEAMERLYNAGHTLVIYTCRAHAGLVEGKAMPARHKAVEAWLQKHFIPYTRIHTGPGKPMAHIYLDDRAMCFRGDWAATLEEICTFKPWTEKEGQK